ncbi:hypothetical protein [Sedimentisphaera salicampi]|uniref:hypothetical protein n=1 Tax=Sedimentisphaera salicampi TaxID=1941349 RepID=UPI000B9B6F4F|nr:hypothetical protein [Sedimentisphaera salicampi]OXU14764.1 hypothetical protein SMSP1_01453 [Sedimentisphaera salicampi]
MNEKNAGIESYLNKKTFEKGQREDILKLVLGNYLSPAFGALPKREIDLIMLEALEKVGYIERQNDIYELVTKLRVTRSKARNLIYDKELRKYSNDEDPDKIVKEYLKRPRIQKQGDLFVLDIENPLVVDHLKFKLKKLGYTSDGSFSQSLVKLSLNSYTALIVGFLDADEQENVRKTLIEAGFPDDRLLGLLRTALKDLAKKYAGDAGAKTADKFNCFIFDLIEKKVSNKDKKYFE